MQEQPIDPKDSRRKLTQWLARRFLLEARYTNELTNISDIAAAFALQDGEYIYIARTDLDPLERKIAAAACAVRTQHADGVDGRAVRVDGVHLSFLRGKFRRDLEQGAAQDGQTLEEWVDRNMLGW